MRSIIDNNQEKVDQICQTFSQLFFVVEILSQCDDVEPITASLKSILDSKFPKILVLMNLNGPLLLRVHRKDRVKKP